jgi:hypothetical protein
MPNWFQTPLVPEAPVRRAQEYIDSPDLERSPWEARFRGFGAGALEGLRGLSSPENLAMLAATGLGAGIGGGMARAGRALPGAVQGLSKALPTLGELAPEWTAVGAEGALNAGRAVPRVAIDPVAQAYSRILAQGGR